MFLMSDAFRERWRSGVVTDDWRHTTVLFVSHQWNPRRDGAEALAGRRLVRCLLDAGARVHVLAAGGADEEFDHPRYTLSLVPTRAFASTRIGRALQMLRSTVPEVAGQWVEDAVTAGLSILASLPADTIIYGRAAPGASNVVAWHLARVSGRPFVAHFSDAWPSFQLMAGGRGWLAPYKWPLFALWRRRILRDAAALTFTNPAEAGQWLAGDGQRYARKAFVVAHLPSARDDGDRPPQYDLFHVVHSGNFYPPGHTAGPLLNGVRLFLDRTPAARPVFRFTHAGWSHGDLPEWTGRCGLTDVVHVVGRLEERDVLALIDSATLLLAIDYARPHSTAVLSKLPDYLNAGRPILAITAPASPMGRLFRDDGAGQTAHYESPAEIADRIGAVYAAWQRRHLDAFLPQPVARASFAPSRVLGELSAAFATAHEQSARVLAMRAVA